MVAEYKVLWSVPGGGSGYSTFHADPNDLSGAPQSWVDAIAAFFEDVMPVVPTTVSISFESEIRVLDSATGALTNVIPVTAPASDSGGSSATYAAGAGGRVDWLTDTIANGRRVRGRTFIVPLTGFEADGTLSTGSLTALTTAHQDYLTTIDAANIQGVVWHRPVNGAGGSTAPIIGGSVPDKSALLRSRRD